MNQQTWGFITVFPNTDKEQELEDDQILEYAKANPAFNGTWMYGENSHHNGCGDEGNVFLKQDGEGMVFDGPDGFIRFVRHVAK